MLVASRSSSAAVSRASGSSAAAVVAPRPACRLAPTAQPQQHCEQVMLVTSRASGSSRQVQARFFRFGKNGFGAEDAGIVGSQGREDYNYDDVEQYFNYMGFLATEGTYDRMEAMLKANHPIDVILLLACSENDTPKASSDILQRTVGLLRRARRRSDPRCVRPGGELLAARFATKQGDPVQDLSERCVCAPRARLWACRWARSSRRAPTCASRAWTARRRCSWRASPSSSRSSKSTRPRLPPACKQKDA